MSWESAADFKKASHGHFFFCLLFMIFFGVGYHHSRHTDWKGTAPYWAFGIVGGVLHFLCMCSSFNVYAKRTKEAEMHNAIGCYRIIVFFLILGSLAGTIGTGVTGACADLEKCIYQENQGVNKAMAICLLILHILSVFYSFSVCGDAEKFQNTGTTPAPDASKTIERPYVQPPFAQRNPEPPTYNTPLPTTYSIASPPSGNMPPPPSYESIMAGAHPTNGLETIAPSVVYPANARAYVT